MKIIKIIFILLILIIPSISFAGRGYDLGGNVSWTVSSGTRICPNGKVLLDITKGKRQGRNGTASCYREDNTPPTISTLGYEHDIWVDKNVNIKVNVKEELSGMGDVYYYVNGIKYNGSEDFNILLTKEGYYTIIIYAEDKATVDSYNGATTSPNLGSSSIIVKIDKTEPKFSKWTRPIAGWFKTRPIIEYKVQDLYKGLGEDKGDGAEVVKEIQIKIFTCPANPLNSTNQYPVVSGEVTGSCDPNIKNCSNDSNFTPNLSDCNWKCEGGYIESSGTCILEEKVLSCNDGTLKLPTNVYLYDKFQNLASDGPSEGKVFWSNPSGVTAGGEFTSKYNSNTFSYFPGITQCKYKCTDGYHFEANQGSKCINDSTVVCCEKTPLGASPGGDNIDCTLAINTNLVQCKYNTLCQGYIKDLLGEWSYSTNKWWYDDSLGNMYEDVGQACGYVSMPHSNGFICDNRYYLIGSESLHNLECVSVPIGEWSNNIKSGNQGNYKYTCTNGGKNSVYTSNGDNNNCTYSCNKGFEKVSGKCISYDWVVGNYGGCSKSCGGGTMYRSVVCKDSNGKTVNDNKCKTTKPVTFAPCNTNPCITNYSSTYKAPKDNKVYYSYKNIGVHQKCYKSGQGGDTEQSHCSAVGTTWGSWKIKNGDEGDNSSHTCYVRCEN